eukprot:9082983-Pyramimonas_sp.AAC.1
MSWRAITSARNESRRLSRRALRVPRGIGRPGGAQGKYHVTIVELTVKTVLSHLITRKINSPINSNALGTSRARHGHCRIDR